MEFLHVIINYERAQIHIMALIINIYLVLSFIETPFKKLSPPYQMLPIQDEKDTKA